MSATASMLCFSTTAPPFSRRTSLAHFFGRHAVTGDEKLPRSRPVRNSRTRRASVPTMAGTEPTPAKKTENKTETPFDLPNAPDDPSRNDGRATAGLFGIRIQTNGDVIKFGFVAIAIAYAFKFGLTSFGVQDLLAGQITTGVVSVASLIGWISTYVFRVGTKGMTYAQQLRDYENEVLKKRYEELSSEELAALGNELEEGD